MSFRRDRVSVLKTARKFRSTQALVTLAACLGVLVCHGAGCSLPSRTFVDDTTGGTSTGGGSAGGGLANGGTAGLIEAGTAGFTESGAGEAGAGGAGAGEAGAPAGGRPGLDRPTPTQGLIVIGGTTLDPAQGVVSVIEPVTGKELAKDLLPAKTQISGIAYDGAAKKDVWYVFVGRAFPAAEDKVVELQVRYFDDKSNAWITLSKMGTQPPPVPGTLTVLNDRLAYLSHTVINQVVTPTLTLIDTSDVLALKAVTYTPSSEAGTMISLIGTRGTAADPSGVGGTLDLSFAQKCTGMGGTPPCELHVLPISVGDTAIVNGVARLMGNYKGTPVSASNHLTQQANFVLSDPAGNVTLYYTDPDAPGSATNFSVPQSVSDLSALTIAECQKLAIFTLDSEHQLIGVRFNNGAAKPLDLGRAGQLVAYEPFSGDVIATYNPPDESFTGDAGIPGPEITAVNVVAPAMGSAITLSPRGSVWSPPSDVRANVLATRFPVSFKCP